MCLSMAPWMGSPAISLAEPPDERVDVEDSAGAMPAEDAEPQYNFFGLEAAPIDEPLVTDRPDFTESALTVPRGRFQLESGYTYTYDSGDGVERQEHVYPEFLLRYGIVDDVELRLTWFGHTHTEERSSQRNDAGRRVNITDRDDSGSDLGVGFKFHLLDQDGLVPDFGVIVDATFPTGSRNQSANDVVPFVGLLWAYDLDEKWALAGNVNFAVSRSETGRYFETSSSVSLGYAITDRLGTYVEYFGFYPSDRNNADSHFANGGFTYLITNNFQVDVRVGMGLNDEADDFFTGAGFAIRF